MPTVHVIVKYAILPSIQSLAAIRSGVYTSLGIAIKFDGNVCPLGAAHTFINNSLINRSAFC